MSQELRDALVEVGQETAVSTPDTNTVLLAFDKAGNAMKPITPQSIIPDGAVQKLESDVTVTVGTGGDYLTINAAIEALSKLKPTYISGGFTATINLLAGFVMAEQVLVEGIDLGWITITGEDAATIIDGSSFTEVISGVDLSVSVTPAFGGDAFAALPKISQSFQQSIGSFLGLTNNSSATVRNDIECVDAIYMISTNCRLDITNTNVVGGGNNTLVNAAAASVVVARGTTFSGGRIAVKIAGASMLHAKNSTMVHSFVGYDIVEGSVADLTSGSMSYTGSPQQGVAVSRGGIVNANGFTVTGNAAQFDLGVLNGGIINANSSTGVLSQAANEIPTTGNGIIFQ